MMVGLDQDYIVIIGIDDKNDTKKLHPIPLLVGVGPLTRESNISASQQLLITITMLQHT